MTLRSTHNDKHAGSRSAAPALLAVMPAACLFGCRSQAVQSAVHPAGPSSAALAGLSASLIAVGGVVLVLVLLLAAAALFVRRRDRPPLGGNGFIVAGGVLLPGVVLVGFLFLSLGVAPALRPGKPVMEIHVIGHQYWWEVRYPQQAIVTANEVYLPAEATVRLRLRSADVIHSLWIPNLNGKMDLLPDHDTQLFIRADTPGRWRAQCAEFCGTQHAKMALWVVALSADEFGAWVRQRHAHAEQTTQGPHARRGLAVFFRGGCHTCHTIHGTRALGRIGPDLTHVGSRLSLGAATLENNRGNLAGWIANPQAIKPGNLMPPTYLPAADMLDLLEYLQRLQ